MLKELNLEGFPALSKEEWKVLAENQLKGSDPSTLNWKVDHALSIEPYYDASDLDGLEYLLDFFSKSNSFNWKLYEEILVVEEKSANKKALEALQGGCDGVVFNIRHEVDQRTLLEGVLTEICDVSVRVSSKELQGDSIANVGGFNAGGNNSNAYTMAHFTTQVEGIVQMLKSIGSESHILRVADSDFFLEIASIRALRFLLSDVLAKDPWSFQIHTTIPLHAEVDHQWFLNSTAGLASILGGTSSVSFTTAEGNSRISRNVGNLIREESGISSYSDQCGGSYFVERLTHSIIQECKSQLN